MRNILFRRVGKIIDSVYDGKCGCNRNTHGVDDRLDPVGACVGPKGSRVRAVVGELRGERVDVILWDADPAVYVANALSPAKVTRVLIDEEKAYAGVIVPDDQLSLAIGKEGQNARLAARLTGWHIDIKSETLAADILKNVPVHEEPAADLIGDRPVPAPVAAVSMTPTPSMMRRT